MLERAPELTSGIQRKDYPENREPKEDDFQFDWRGTELGRDALIIMMLWMEARVSCALLAITRKFKRHEISNANLLAVLKQHLPEFFPFYEKWMIEQYGKEFADTRAKYPDHFNPSLLMARVYMWFQKHKGKGKGMSMGVKPEHPVNWAYDECPDRVLHWYEELKKR